MVSLPDFYPRALAFDGERVWVATFFGIRMLDADYNIVASFRPGRRPNAMIYAGGYIFASNSSDGTVTAVALPDRIRELGGTLPASIPPGSDAPMPVGQYEVGRRPIALEWDGESLWVANNHDNTIVKVSAHDGEILATVQVGEGPRGMAFDGEDIWVTNSLDGSVSRVSTDGELEATFDVGALPGDVAFDGESVWVSNRSSGTVNRMALDGTPLGTFHLGRAPGDMLYDGEALWVMHEASDAISRLTMEGVTVEHFDVGDAPVPIVYDGEAMWIANALDGTIMKLSLDGEGSGGDEGRRRTQRDSVRRRLDMGGEHDEHDRYQDRARRRRRSGRGDRNSAARRDVSTANTCG